MANPTPEAINRAIREAMGWPHEETEHSNYPESRSVDIVPPRDPYHSPADADDALRWWVAVDPDNRWVQIHYAIDAPGEWLVGLWSDGKMMDSDNEAVAPTLPAAISLAIHRALEQDNG